MCVICVKPEGVKLPKFEYFKNCYLNNSDGLGFMTTVGGAVVGWKDYKTVYQMYKDMQKYAERPIVAHFRFATHGAEDFSASHPFPVSSREIDLKKGFWKSDLGVAHNGIFSGFGESNSTYVYVGGRVFKDANKKVGLSDTQEFIKDVLADPEIRPSLNKPSTQKLIGKLINSNKLAFLDSGGGIFTIGKFLDDMGCMWSNDGYKEYVVYTYTGFETNKYSRSLGYFPKEDNENIYSSECPNWCIKKEEDMNCWTCDELVWEGSKCYCDHEPV